MAKKISFGLSVNEIRKAQKELEIYKKEFISKVKEFTERLAEEGVKVAQLNISEMSAVFTGELFDSIDKEPGDTIKYGDSWIIYTNCPWAQYVEFGTGVVGSKNPHPDTSIARWSYDVNNHGESGWVYYRNGQFYRTRGMPSRPFMYETAQEIGFLVSRIAKEVFSD